MHQDHPYWQLVTDRGIMKRREAALPGGIGMITDTLRMAPDENTGADTVIGRIVTDLSLIDSTLVSAQSAVPTNCKLPFRS